MAEIGNIYRFPTGLVDLNTTDPTSPWYPLKTTDVIISECKAVVTTDITSTGDVVVTIYKNDIAIGTITIASDAVEGETFYGVAATGYGNLSQLDADDKFHLATTTAATTSGAADVVEVLYK